MARTIGKVKIRKLKKLVYDTYNDHAKKYGVDSLAINSYQLQEEVKGLIPEDWFDTWESAWSEIERLVDDAVSDYLYGEKS